MYSGSCREGKRLITVPDNIRDADELRQTIQSHGSGHVLVTYTPESRYTAVLPRNADVPYETSANKTSLLWTPPKQNKDVLINVLAPPMGQSDKALDK